MTYERYTIDFYLLQNSRTFTYSMDRNSSRKYKIQLSFCTFIIDISDGVLLRGSRVPE